MASRHPNVARIIRAKKVAEARRKHRTIIPKRAIQRFLDRPRKDYRRRKLMTFKELDALLDKLPIEPPIWKRLNHDQLVCFTIGAETRRFAFWADTGTGKTFLSIALVRYFKKLLEGTLASTLVLIPSKINKYEWAREIRKWSPNTSYVVLKGSSEQKWRQIDEAVENGTTLILETYGGLVRLATKPTKGGALKINATRMKWLKAAVQGIILDESIHVVKKGRSGSLMYRICKSLADVSEIAFALNGTPHGRDPADMWGQMRIVDRGYTLGETLGLFRAAFYDEKENPFGGIEYTFKKEMGSTLNRMIAHSSLRIEADESELPDVVPRKKIVRLGTDALTLYQRTKKELIDAHKDRREMKNAFMRMRQISSGWVGYYDDEEGRKAHYGFTPNPKLELLASLLDQVRERKSIVYHDFIFSGALIERELKRLKIGYVRLKDSKEEPGELLDRFDNDDEVRVFILNNFEASGLNLQTADYGFFYESPVSIIKRKQAERRFVRQHSKHSRVFLYDLVVDGTMDGRILELHKEGRDLYEVVVEGRDWHALDD